LALAEIEEAYHWLGEQSPGAAARWYRGLRKAIDSLQTNPERFRLPLKAVLSLWNCVNYCTVAGGEFTGFSSR
jgi:plasmid stabilization system protein ParE